MKSLLEELFCGNICPGMDCGNHSEQKKQLVKHIADHHNNLNNTLIGKQQEVLERFDDCYCELTNINKREIFIYAFRLGARVAIEVLYPSLGCTICYADCGMIISKSIYFLSYL